MIKYKNFLLTITSFKCHASRDTINDDDADDMTAIILDKAFELLDLLLDWVPYVLLTLGIHVDIWSFDA